MSTEENKELVRRFIEESMNLEAVDQFVAPDMIDHSRHGARSLADVKQEVELFAAAFPDRHATIENPILEGDKVMLHDVASGETVERSRLPPYLPG